MGLLCKIFGHDWKDAGRHGFEYKNAFGLWVTVKRCSRCKELKWNAELKLDMDKLNPKDKDVKCIDVTESKTD